MKAKTADIAKSQNGRFWPENLFHWRYLRRSASFFDHGGENYEQQEANV